mgnify:CR=1 FL=1
MHPWLLPLPVRPFPPLRPCSHLKHLTTLWPPFPPLPPPHTHTTPPTCARACLQGLAKSIAWDGEGATVLIECEVLGAADDAAANKVLHKRTVRQQGGGRSRRRQRLRHP